MRSSIDLTGGIDKRDSAGGTWGSNGIFLEPYTSSSQIMHTLLKAGFYHYLHEDF